jgi:hypothetical protein
MAINPNVAGSGIGDSIPKRRLKPELLPRVRVVVELLHEAQ